MWLDTAQTRREESLWGFLKTNFIIFLLACQATFLTRDIDKVLIGPLDAVHGFLRPIMGSAMDTIGSERAIWLGRKDGPPFFTRLLLATLESLADGLTPAVRAKSEIARGGHVSSCRLAVWRLSCVAFVCVEFVCFGSVLTLVHVPFLDFLFSLFWVPPPPPPPQARKSLLLARARHKMRRQLKGMTKELEPTFQQMALVHRLTNLPHLRHLGRRGGGGHSPQGGVVGRVKPSTTAHRVPSALSRQRVVPGRVTPQQHQQQHQQQQQQQQQGWVSVDASTMSLDASDLEAQPYDEFRDSKRSATAESAGSRSTTSGRVLGVHLGNVRPPSSDSLTVTPGGQLVATASPLPPIRAIGVGSSRDVGSRHVEFSQLAAIPDVDDEPQAEAPEGIASTESPTRRHAASSVLGSPAVYAATSLAPHEGRLRTPGSANVSPHPRPHPHPQHTQEGSHAAGASGGSDVVV